MIEGNMLQNMYYGMYQRTEALSKEDNPAEVSDSLGSHRSHLHFSDCHQTLKYWWTEKFHSENPNKLNEW